MCVATSRCLSAQQNYPVQTQSCQEPDMNAAELMRASENQDQFEDLEESADEVKGMTDEQREYFRWLYRTEDRKYCCLSQKS
ncbi:hypothetical protein GOODEAATRI_028314 [Goodea atripinnis]|uniref:Uncharacterized protein n=1 Tax=Goodea atripinnis TaxID=208336 RepID=A0ABV0NYW4_9TELE